VTVPTPSTSDALSQSQALCRDITRARAGNFWHGIRLFPAHKRSAIFALYAWSRVGDDLADAESPAHERREALAEFRAHTEAVLADARAAATLGGVWPAFAHTLATYPIEHDAVRDMLDGLEQDTGVVELATWDELDTYCDRVASSVGRMCVSVWGPAPGVEPDRLRAPAIQRGRAFQLVNILRDVAEDYDAAPRRVYLPAEAFDAEGLTPRDLRGWTDPERCRRCIEATAARARGCFEASSELESLVEPACVPGLVAMTRIYRGILARIERDPAVIVGIRRVSLPAWQKVGIGLRAAAGRLTVRRGT
jgi:phytoene synthase